MKGIHAVKESVALKLSACRSDMQRERARERIDRARRQWEIENGQIDPSGVGSLWSLHYILNMSLVFAFLA